MKAAITLFLVATLTAGCTTGNDGGGDRDGDGLSDRDEQRGWLVDVLGSASGAYHVTSDPDVQDTDGDGLSDLYELGFGTDPRLADTDADGLTDCQEVRHTVRAECEDPDFRGGTDGGFRTNARMKDTDSDGLEDGVEVAGVTIVLPGPRERHVVTDPLKGDSDADGLRDGLEVHEFGSDPGVVDTDGDGCGDAVDMFPRFDERLGIHPHTFTWKQESPAQADIVFFTRIADAAGFWPSDGFRTEGRSEQSLDTVDPYLVRPAQCSFSPIHPWVRIDLEAIRLENGEQVEAIDMHSTTNPAGAVSVWWNTRDGGFAWNFPDVGAAPEFTATDGRLTWEGTEAAFTFEPYVDPALEAPAAQGA